MNIKVMMQGRQRSWFDRDAGVWSDGEVIGLIEGCLARVTGCKCRFDEFLTAAEQAL